MLSFLKNIFKPDDGKIKPGSCYGVLHGQFVGELFVFIEEEKDTLCFLSIPNMKNRDVPRDKFDYAMKNGVLEYIENLPRNERSVCILQYKSNTNKNDNEDK